MNKPAQTSKKSDSEICATTKLLARRARCSPPETLPESSFNTEMGARSEARHAGSTPKITPVTSESTMVLSLVTGVIFGVLPAWRASDLAPISVLKEDSGSVSGGLHRARLASSLVVAQISLSLFLLVCAGLFIRSFRAAQTLNPGFNSDHV